MKTNMMMKGLMLVAMMSVTTAMMAATASKGIVKNNKINSSTTLTYQRGHNHEASVVVVSNTYAAPAQVVVTSGRGHATVAPLPPRECRCHECKKHRRAWDKHLRKHAGRHSHDSRTCHECHRYSHLLMRTHR